MRAKEFILEVNINSIVNMPVKGGITAGKAVAAKQTTATNKPIDELAALELLGSADPTNNNSMTKWLVKIFLSNESNFTMPEDINQIKTDLTKFMQLQKTRKLKPEHNDLNRLKSLSQLYDILEQYDDADTVSNKQQDKKIKSEGVKFIIDDPKFAVIITKTYEANCYYGAGTKWCTASENSSDYFDQYSNDGPLYVVLNNSGPKPRKYQYHYESASFLNERDEEVPSADIDALSKNPGWAKFLNMIINKHQNDTGKQMLNVLQIYKMHSQPEQLLNGDRFAEFKAEREQAAENDVDLIMDKIMAAKNEGDYAERWPEYESALMKDPYAAMEYAEEILEEPWPEAEPGFKQNKELWAKYQEIIAR